VADIQWLKKPEAANYPAAQSYLGLVYEEAKVRKLVQRLRRARITRFKAKDIFRASGLSLLGLSNEHVEKDRKKIRAGKPLSPILLVRDEAHGKVVIADGYHRLCAVYSFDEDAEIPCRIVETRRASSPTSTWTRSMRRSSCCAIPSCGVSPSSSAAAAATNPKRRPIR